MVRDFGALSEAKTPLTENHPRGGSLANPPDLNPNQVVSFLPVYQSHVAPFSCNSRPQPGILADTHRGVRWVRYVSGKEAAMAKKSEKKRQEAAQKKKDKAEARRKRAAARAYDESLDGQLTKLSTLARDSGQSLALLLQGLTPEAVAEKVGLNVVRVNEVQRAFLKLPAGIRKLLEENPQTLGNSEAIEAIKFGSKHAKRGSDGKAELSPEAMEKVAAMIMKGQNPS